MLAAAAVAQAETTNAPTLAQRLCAGYRSIETVACEIRKTTTGAGQTVRLLSRVYYRKPECVHVDNVAPTKRRIIADGQRLYYYQEGLPRGYSKPIQDLAGDWLDAVRNVPGTPLENLLKIEHRPEIPQPPADGLPVRAAYDTGAVTVRLSCDGSNRLQRIDFFDSPAMTNPTARIEYGNFLQVGATDVWIPRLHKTVLFKPGGENMTETRYIDGLTVNAPVAASLFNASTFFKDVEFTDDFQKTYTR